MKLFNGGRLGWKALVPLSIAPLGVAGVAYAAGGAFNNADPHSYDPAHTDLVTSGWVNGIGCPTDATTATPNATYTGVGGTAPYSDPACQTGDPTDQHNAGLLLAKTGPTTNFAAAQVQLTGIKPGTVLSELGYDLRGGSHCGAGAPRFEVVTTDGHDWNIGCASPPGAPSTSSNTEWTRLRWSGGGLQGYDAANGYTFGAVTGPVKSISIVFDEGQDQGTGLAVLDNIDVNGTLVGHGANGNS